MTPPLDAYALRARLFPALIATAPAITLAGTLITWNQFHVSQAIAALVLSVLLFAFADYARRQGKRIQRDVFRNIGGVLPSVAMLRHSDTTLHATVKERIVTFVGKKIGRSPPTEAQERAEPAEAGSFYDHCGVWLREHMRGPAFKLLLEENITYGFRRNLLGMKYIGFGLSAFTLIIAGSITVIRYRADPSQDLSPFLLIVVVAALHAAYFALVVTRISVQQAGGTYAHQLFASCETLMGGPKPAPAKAKA